MEALPSVLGELKPLELHAVDKLASIRNYKTLDLRFRALLSEGAPYLCFERP